MASWMTYKGLTIPDTTVGDAGGYLTADLRGVADGSAHVEATTDPGTGNDSSPTQGYFPGSTWFNKNTQVMWVCVNATTSAAKWRSLYQRIDNAIVLMPSAGIGGGSDARAFQMDAGGNARGTSAIDLQTARSSSTQVASGMRSLIAAGSGNTASGAFSSVTGGNANHASSSSSHVAGGTGNAATAMNAHAEGSNTTASGIASHAEGIATSAIALGSHAEGANTYASGVDSHAEGDYTTASGYYSHAEGRSTTSSGFCSHSEGYLTTSSSSGSHSEGFDTTASADYSHAEGAQTTASSYAAHAEGVETSATANFSHSGGYTSVAHLRGQWARSSGGHSSQNGTAQATITHLLVRTTDSTATELTLDGNSPSSGNRFSIVAGQTLSCFINIVGRKESAGTNDHASFLRQVCIRNTSGTTQLAGSVQTIGTDINPAGWGGLSITADDTNDSLKIQVTGAASTNIRWTATVFASEVADAAI